MAKNARDISLEQASVLKSRIQDYMNVKDKIPSGLSDKALIEKRKIKILEVLGATEKQWDDWHWQVSARITDSNTLSKIIGLTEKQKLEIDQVSAKFRWAISPNFLTLIGDDDLLTYYENPVFLQSVPIGLELKGDHMITDPMGEGVYESRRLHHQALCRSSHHQCDQSVRDVLQTLSETAQYR